MHDYDTAFNAGLYEVEQDRRKRAKRRKDSFKKKNERFEIAKDCCCFGWVVKDELFVQTEVTQVQRVYYQPVYEQYFNYMTYSYGQKQIGVEKVEKSFNQVTGKYQKIEPYLLRYSATGRKTLSKQQTNRRIRRNKDNFTLGREPSSYKKVFDYWDMVC